MFSLSPPVSVKVGGIIKVVMTIPVLFPGSNGEVEKAEPVLSPGPVFRVRSLLSTHSAAELKVQHRKCNCGK